MSLSPDVQRERGGVGGCTVLSQEAFCHSDGRKQFLGHMSRMCSEEARKDGSDLVRSCI